MRMVKLLPEGRAHGHKPPLQQYDWMVGCLGLRPTCKPLCIDFVAECMNGKRREEPNLPTDLAYGACMRSQPTIDAGCASCAPTLPMLALIEGRPSEVQLSHGLFGTQVEERVARSLAARPQRPHDSRCTSEGRAWEAKQEEAALVESP